MEIVVVENTNLIHSEIDNGVGDFTVIYRQRNPGEVGSNVIVDRKRSLSFSFYNDFFVEIWFRQCLFILVTRKRFHLYRSILFYLFLKQTFLPYLKTQLIENTNGSY